MRKVLVMLLVALCCVFASLPGCSSRTNPDGSPNPVPPDTVPEDSEETTRHWKNARAYQQYMRYELARQEYLLALATCRSTQTKDRLQRELQIVEMQIRTLR